MSSRAGPKAIDDRLAELVAELVRLNVDVIVTFQTPAALAAKRATTTIPIVMAGAADPVGTGLVASLARPGGNVTGSIQRHRGACGQEPGAHPADRPPPGTSPCS
ncbi:MAG: hypothetical protein MZW92_32080 [Comamonadaceae bacterium]|nr:hypothetical protein [Comamonadaceae bacterium]